MDSRSQDRARDEEMAEDELSRNERKAFQRFVGAMPLPSPPEIATSLEQLGYKGQDDQRNALALMAYRHVRRLKRLHIDGEQRRNLPPKQNILMLGPTGCGKTFLVELLFQHIFRLPTVVVDITSFTESGYVGDDVHTVLTRLVHAADGNMLLASCGVVCLDEFDKIASSSSTARFAGQGTTKDVSGYGVQRELLAMLEGTDVMVPMDYGFSAFGERVRLSTRDIPFIACGAFSGFDEMLKTSSTSIGFRGGERGDRSIMTLDEVSSFQKYGFLPELIGRFSRFVSFAPLPEETLRQILVENVLPQFVNEFSAEGLRLTVTREALDHMIARSQKRGTGARGLHTELVAAVERAAFDTFQRLANSEVIIDCVSGRLESLVRKRA
jgi:ATP-dependent Clp protease ATP-binding subunit ClpX